MTRKEKYARLRAKIEMENMDYMFINFQDWVYIHTHQREIKKMKGAKH